MLKKEYIFDNMLPDIINEFKQLFISKTPYQKLKCINNILVYVVNLIKFNEGENMEVGADNISPVLNYVFIKSHPFRIFTDIEFIKLFSYQNGDLENGLVNIESICNFVLNHSAKDYNLSQEEYDRKCNEAIHSHKKSQKFIDN